MAVIPASIRYNNPGAMWGGNAITKKWGETQHVTLNDGLGQGNQIAVFPTKVAGASAQFDLWHTSKNYKGKKLSDAIRTWSGGNSSAQYVSFLTKRVPGLTGDTIIDDKFLNSPSGIQMMKAQAWHEAGREYPMTDAEWLQAQKAVFKTAPTGSGTAAGAVVVGGGAIAAASSNTVWAWVQGHWVLIAIGVIGLGILIDLGFAIYNNEKKLAVTNVQPQ